MYAGDGVLGRAVKSFYEKGNASGIEARAFDVEMAVKFVYRWSCKNIKLQS